MSVSAQQLVAHLASRHVDAARAFGFTNARLPLGTGTTPADADLAAAVNALADEAAEQGDVALLQDLLFALAEPAAAEARWARMHAPETLAGGTADTLFAVYDLNAGPVTYDFIQFLVLAERFRHAARKPHLRLLIVPGEHDGFRNFSQRDRFLSVASKEWRLRQLVMRAPLLLPACAGVTRFRSREQAAAFIGRLDPDAVFPPGFDDKAPVCPYQLAFVMQFATQGPDIRTLTAPPVTCALVQRLFHELAGERPVVTITIRQSDFQQPRNSRMDQWLRFAERCERSGLFPLFVPDTEAILDGSATDFGGFASLPLAALSLPVRAAACQESWHNMLANGGPYTLCLYNARVRFSMFKLLVPGIVTASREFHEAQGLAPGSQLPFAGPLQRLVWEDDSADALQRELDHVMEEIPVAARRPAAADPRAAQPAR
jgi:hypothetical protein